MDEAVPREDDGDVHASASELSRVCVRARRKVNKFSLFSIPILGGESCAILRSLSLACSDSLSVFLSFPVHTTLSSAASSTYTCLEGRF